MKLTKSKLKQLIKEELQTVLQEQKVRLAVVSRQYVAAAMQIPEIKAAVGAGTIKFAYGRSRSCERPNFRKWPRARIRECNYLMLMATKDYDSTGAGNTKRRDLWRSMAQKHALSKGSSIVYLPGGSGPVDPSWGEDPKWIDVVSNQWLALVEYRQP